MNLENLFCKRVRRRIGLPEPERRSPDEGVVAEEAMCMVAEAKCFV